jgi:hypothetical protein
MCKISTKLGEFRAAIESERINLLAGEFTYAAKVTRVFLLKPTGEQIEITIPPLEEGHGATEGSAKAETCRAFKEWAEKQAEV